VARSPINMTSKGFKEIMAEMERVAVDTERALLKAVETAVQSIAGNADEMVPEDEGQLRASQDIVRPRRSGNSITASISYGGPSAPYALIQHENADLWHPPKPPGKRRVGGAQGSGPTEPGNTTFGGPKYLEFPFDREVESWPEGFKTRLIAAGMDLLRK